MIQEVEYLTNGFCGQVILIKVLQCKEGKIVPVLNYHVMKLCGVNGNKHSASCFSHFTPQKKEPLVHTE
jgi:hypothetical protein